MAAVLVTNISVYIGTAAERAALSTTRMKAGSVFEETDTGLKYKWSGAAWSSSAEESVSLGAGASLIGKVGIDQVTANANEVVTKTGSVTTATLAAGTNLLGKVGIDQATANANEVVTKTGSVTTATLSAETTKVIGTVNDKIADGDNVTLGAKADAKSTATDTTAVTAMSVLKEISHMEQNPASRAVTNAGTFAVQATQALISDYGQAILDHADVTTAQALVAAVADKKFYLTSLVLSVAAAGSYWLEDDDAAQITCKFTLAANGGCAHQFPVDTPFKSTTVNKGLKVKGSVAGAVGCMITYYTLA